MSAWGEDAKINQVVLSAAAYSAGWTKSRRRGTLIGKLEGLTFLRREEGRMSRRRWGPTEREVGRHLDASVADPGESPCLG